MKTVGVPSLEAFDALERRVVDLERRLSRARVGAGWIPVARSPIGSRATRRLVHAGQLQATRQGRRLFVLADEVDAYLAARPVMVTSPTATATPAEVTDDGKGYAERHLHLLAAGVRQRPGAP